MPPASRARIGRARLSSGFKIGGSSRSGNKEDQKSWRLELATGETGAQEEAAETLQDELDDSHQTLTRSGSSDDESSKRRRSVSPGPDGDPKRLKAHSTDANGDSASSPSKQATDGEKAVSAGSPQKRKVRYAWMDDDDASVTESDEDDEDDTEEIESKSEPVVPPPTDTYQSQSDQIENMLRVAFVSNITWEAKLEDLRNWIAEELAVPASSVTEIVPDPDSFSDKGNPFNMHKASTSGDRKHGRSIDHKGKAYVEFSSFEVIH
eukprot:Selendium_serpulae@DN3457_c0_g1_i3.p1